MTCLAWYVSHFHDFAFRSSGQENQSGGECKGWWKNQGWAWVDYYRTQKGDFGRAGIVKKEQSVDQKIGHVRKHAQISTKWYRYSIKRKNHSIRIGKERLILF